jgi:hypothetical protein
MDENMCLVYEGIIIQQLMLNGSVGGSPIYLHQ